MFLEDLYSDNEPPRKRPFTGNPTPPAMKRIQSPVKSANAQNGGENSAMKSSKATPKSKLYEQLCKSTSDGSSTSKTPFSWNPDLEIEVLNPSSPSDDTESLRQRIDELGRFFNLI